MTSAAPKNQDESRAVPCAAAVIAAALLLAPASGRARGAGVAYTDPQYGYSLVAPPGWTRKTDMPRPFVAFMGPIEDGFQTNFNVDPEPAANKTLAQYVKAARESAAKDKAIGSRIERRATLAGGPAVIVQSVVTLQGRTSIARQIVAVHGGRGYTITLSVAPAALKKNLPAFKRVIASFRWQPARPRTTP